MRRGGGFGVGNEGWFMSEDFVIGRRLCLFGREALDRYDTRYCHFSPLEFGIFNQRQISISVIHVFSKKANLTPLRKQYQYHISIFQQLNDREIQYRQIITHFPARKHILYYNHVLCSSLELQRLKSTQSVMG